MVCFFLPPTLGLRVVRVLHQGDRERVARGQQLVFFHALVPEAAVVQAVEGKPRARATAAKTWPLAEAADGAEVLEGDPHFLPFALMATVPMGFQPITTGSSSQTVP